jgi:release factor glutamine methyltransferase
VVDVGTGCGAVALALSAALPRATVLAIDTSEAAVACARRNRDRLRLRNVSIRRGSLLTPAPRRLRGRVAVIAGNLPYLPPELGEAALRTFPPGTALGLGRDGLDLPRELAATARDFLVAGGSLVLQMADFQWPPFSDELRSLGYDAPVLHDPLPKRPVVGRARWPGWSRASLRGATDGERSEEAGAD